PLDTAGRPGPPEPAPARLVPVTRSGPGLTRRPRRRARRCGDRLPPHRPITCGRQPSLGLPLVGPLPVVPGPARVLVWRAVDPARHVGLPVEREASGLRPGDEVEAAERARTVDDAHHVAVVDLRCGDGVRDDPVVLAL